MGRTPREESKTGLYHVANRGNNKKTLFHSSADFQKYLKLVATYLQKIPVKLHHYCLMPNHVHMLLWAKTHKELSLFMRNIQRIYNKAYSETHGYVGQLYQGRFRSFSIEHESYLLECGRYIERNPVRAGLVNHPQDWKYSSCAVYTHNKQSKIISYYDSYLNLSSDSATRRKRYQNFIEISRPYEKLLDQEFLK